MWWSARGADDMKNSRTRELMAYDVMNSSRLWMKINDSRLWAQGLRCYEYLRVMDDMNDSRSWTKGYGWHKRDWVVSLSLRCYEQLRARDDLNDLGSWVEHSRCYKKLRVMEDMNNSRSWAKGTQCYEQHRNVDDTNDWRSHELRALNSMNSHGCGWYEQF